MKPARPASRAPKLVVRIPSTVTVVPSAAVLAVAMGTTAGDGEGEGVTVGEAVGVESGDGDGLADGPSVGPGVALGAAVPVASGVAVGLGVVVASGAVGDGLAEAPVGGLARFWGRGAAVMMKSAALSLVSSLFPASPPGRRSMDEPAGGAGAGLPSTKALAASPHPTASTTVPVVVRRTRLPPVAARPPL